MLRWGILSTANHAAQRVIPAIRAAGQGEVIAVASRDAGRAREYAKELGIPTSYGSYEQLLADPAVDVIYNPLPNHLHKEWSIRAAQAGKHVLCEKPFALNAAEAEDMVRAFRSAGLKLAEAFQWRHHPQGLRLRDLVRQGKIGDLRLIVAEFGFMLGASNDIRWKPECGGGALYDVGCYPISFVRFITGQEPIAVTAQIHRSKTGVDDLTVASLEFPGGILAQITGSFAVPLRRYYEVVGSKGSLLVNRTYNPIGDRPEEIVYYGDDREVIEVIPLPQVDSYMLMIRDFSAAVLENRELAFPPEDAVANMSVIDAIFRAAEKGMTVKV